MTVSRVSRLKFLSSVCLELFQTFTKRDFQVHFSLDEQSSSLNIGP
jgi:hypothetical protein